MKPKFTFYLREESATKLAEEVDKMVTFGPVKAKKMIKYLKGVIRDATRRKGHAS